MIYYGKGFTHSDVYNMPVFLREFYYKKLADTRKAENDAIDKQNKKMKSQMSKYK
jgi:hypothetical protein